MNKINQIKTILGMQVKLESKTLANGVVIEAESFEAGNEVFAISDEEKIPLPVNEYEIGDGEILVVLEEGIIAEIKTKEEEEAETEEVEEVAEEEVAEQAMESEAATPKKIVESISKEMFFSEIEALKSEIESLKLALEPKEEVKEEAAEEVELSAETVETEETKEEVKVELSEEVKPIAHNPEANAPAKKLFLYGQNGAKTTKQTVYSKLFGNK